MDFSTLIKSRYSVRAYRPDPVENEKLEQVLEAARLAPTAANRQPFRIIVAQTAGRQEEMRRIDRTDTIIKFEELEHRIEYMEAEADMVNFSRKPTLEDELERLTLDEEIESELQALKSPSIDKMEERVEALQTILDDQEREEMNHEQK